MEIKNIFNENLLKNKLFVIAGGSSGIGASVAHDISALCGNVILIARNEEKIRIIFEHYK